MKKLNYLHLTFCIFLSGYFFVDYAQAKEECELNKNKLVGEIYTLCFSFKTIISSEEYSVLRKQINETRKKLKFCQLINESDKFKYLDIYVDSIHIVNNVGFYLETKKNWEEYPSVWEEVEKISSDGVTVECNEFSVNVDRTLD